MHQNNKMLKNSLVMLKNGHFKIKSPYKIIGLATLCACIALTAPAALSPAYAITNGQIRQAEEAYEKALVSFHGGDTAAAKIYLKNALKANPRHLSSRILMAELLIKNGDGSGAEVHLNYARERGADFNSLIVPFGYSYILQGRNKYLLDNIINGNRDNNIEAEISYLRGRAYFGHKQIANAKRSYQQAIDRKPDFQKAILGLAQIAATYEKYAQAMDYIDTVLAFPDPDPNAWILKAKIYKQRGSIDQAITAINQALEKDNSNILSRITRAALYIDKKNFEDAEKDVDFILDKYPREPRAKYLKAIITAVRGDLTLSKSNMTEIINTLRSLPPQVMTTSPIYYYLAGLTNFQFGDLDEARDSLQKYLKLENKDVSAMRLLGALELQAGDPRAANVILTNANRTQQNNPTTLTMLGLVYLKLGNIEKANYYLESVTKILPDSSDSLANLARGKMAAGSFETAINNLLKAEQHNLDNIDIKLLLVKAYQQSKQYGKAVDIIRELRKKEPENIYLLNLYGTAVGLNGNLKEARSSYEKALDLDKNNIVGLIHLARMDVLEGKSSNAINDLRQRLTQVPNDPALMLELGNIYKIIKDPKEALFWYKKAYSINNKNLSTLSHLIDGYLINNDSASAIQVTNEFLGRYPKNSEALGLLGKLYQEAGNPTEAIRAFSLAVDYAIKRGAALQALAKAQLKNNDIKSATKTLQKAIAWDPDLSEAYIALIKLYIRNIEGDKGFDLLSHLRTITQPSNPAADILTGDLHMALRNYEQAEISYQAALKIGDTPLATMGLYKVYQQSGRMNKAITTLEDWHDKYPQDMRTALALGNAYKRDGQITKAVSFLEKLLVSQPDMPIILNNAATANFAIGNEDKALEYAKRANSILPNNANILDTLAWIESQRGKPEIALPLLRKALVLQFSNPVIKYHLAMTLDKLNRRGEARKLLAEALSSRTDFPEKKAAKATLKQWLEK